MVILLLQCLPRLPWYKLQCWTLCDGMAWIIQVIPTWNHNVCIAQYVWVSCSLVYVKSERIIIWETNVFHYYILLAPILKSYQGDEGNEGSGLHFLG